MAILAVNAGSSSLKFSLHPLLGGRVRPSVLSGTIEGLEPGGQPEMAWTFAGQRQRKAVGGPGATPFLQALDCLRTLLAGLEGGPRTNAPVVITGGDRAPVPRGAGFAAGAQRVPRVHTAGRARRTRAAAVPHARRVRPVAGDGD